MREFSALGTNLVIVLPGRTQTLSLAIYDAVQSGNDELANGFVLITSAVCILILVGSSQLLRVRHA